MGQRGPSRQDPRCPGRACLQREVGPLGSAAACATSRRVMGNGGVSVCLCVRPTPQVSLRSHHLWVSLRTKPLTRILLPATRRTLESTYFPFRASAGLGKASWRSSEVLRLAVGPGTRRGGNGLRAVGKCSRQGAEGEQSCAPEGGAGVRGPPEGEPGRRVCAGGPCGCHWGMGAVGSGACWVCGAADGSA